MRAIARAVNFLFCAVRDRQVTSDDINSTKVHLLADFEKDIFDNNNVASRQDIIEQLIQYIKDELKKGTRLNQIMRHTLGLFHGQTGASYWKRYLSENMCVRDADVQKIDHILDKVKYLPQQQASI